MTRLIEALLIACVAAAAADTKSFRPKIPATWDEAALADWATPVTGLNVRPTHIAAKEYYSLPIDNLRTYPVYYPGREPKGYWEMLQHVGARPLIEPGKLKNEADWLEAGHRIFDELDLLPLRTFDPKFITAARNPETFAGLQPLPDGTVKQLRWVPTNQGVALSFANCGGCHLLHLQDGTRIPGAPLLAGVSRTRTNRFRPPALIGLVQSANRVVDGDPPFIMAGAFGTWLHQAYGVPWRPGEWNEKLNTMTEAERQSFQLPVARAGAVLRWNGSLFYPAKIPDLIGIKDRKYIDHTATHLHRGIGDLMRYAALVSYAETADFGPYHMLAPDTKRVQGRAPDEALYALALYIYSLKPPANPNPFDAKANDGQRIFAREGCPNCHTPPLYTNNKLTLAQGFVPPRDKPASLDVLSISVGTDPGLALETRKGTGYYKVPSLKGVWYRGHYLHDGSAASLEEMFDPERLLETHVPEGWLPPGMKTRAIQGHQFGLNLNREEREQLIAFLKTL